MTVQEINDLIKQHELKIEEIKSILSDMNSCSGERSKQILLGAASKLAEVLKPVQNIR